MVTASKGDCNIGNDGLIHCMLGDLAPGEQATIQITKDTGLLSGKGGDLCDEVTADFKGSDSNYGDNRAEECTRVNPPPEPVTDLEIVKADHPDPVVEGEQLVYTLVVKNHGPSVATGVVVADDLPTTVDFVSASVLTGGSCSEHAGTVKCSVGTLLPGSAAKVVIKVTPNKNPCQDRTLLNKVAVKGNEADPTPENNFDDETTTVRCPNPDVNVEKSDDVDPATKGDRVTYTITVTNKGDDTARGVKITDREWWIDP